MEDLPRRKNVRLKEFDYAQRGYYFVTICTKARKECFRSVGPDTIGLLSPVGQIAQQGLNQIHEVHPHIVLDKYCIMPNHLHIILAFGPMLSGPTLGRVIGRFKAYVSRCAGFPVWQDDYYEHVIRSERDYLGIWRYIDENPLKWAEDKYYPGGVCPG